MSGQHDEGAAADELRRRSIEAALLLRRYRGQRRVRRRVLVGPSATPTVTNTYRHPKASVAGPLLRAFTAQQVADIDYTDQAGTASTRTIETHYLYYSLPVWYALAWDRLRDDARSFRIDRITKLTATTTTFRLRPAEPFTTGAELDARPV